MRVLAVIITPPTYRASGGVAAGLALTEALVDKVDITAAMMADADGECMHGQLQVRKFRCTNSLGPLRSIAPRQLTTALWQSRIAAYLDRLRPDIVHLHNPMPPLALWNVARACLHRGIPYVVSSHGFVEMTQYAEAYQIEYGSRIALGPLVTRPFYKAVRNASAICMLSPYERPLMQKLGIPDSRLAVVTNGVTPYYTKCAEALERASVVERFHSKDNRPNLLFVGNHTKNKGLDILLHALHQVQVPVRVIVAGAIRSLKEHEALYRLCAVDKLGDRVVFTDHVTEAELRALYQTVDVFVFPSRADTLPLVVIEAMISGLPVISTKIGGIPFQVTSETGMLVPVDDPTALAMAISAIATDPIQRRAMGDAGRIRARQLFDWNHAADAALEVYNGVTLGTLQKPLSLV